ncbi:hypothetical protein NEOKW01_0227 [Nematocida sp. AWRm80]|nr:hypothetical protein NEOKW01_0227 [Nematocida sp. AWRm80]
MHLGEMSRQNGNSKVISSEIDSNTIEYTSRSKRKENDIITLVSSSGEEVYLEYHILCESSILKYIIDTDAFLESQTGIIVLPIETEYLKRIVEYLRYKYNYNIKEGDVDDFVVQDNETADLLDVSLFLRI